MNKKVRIMGKKLVPMWLIAILLIASGTGAAVGSVVAGKISGEINVSTTGSAGGLQIGGPYCDIIQHTPNEARDDVGGLETFSDLDDEFTEEEYFSIAFADEPSDTYASIAGGFEAAPEQGFRFYVGPAEDIEKIVVSWEGYATTAHDDGLMVTEGDSLVTVETADIPVEVGETEVKITLTEDEITAAVPNDMLYVLAVGVAFDILNTDYIVATVTYKSIDLANWTDFYGTEIFEREFPVPSRCIGVHSDDQTGFEAASELGVGDWWMFMLPIRNASSQTITAKLTLEVPSCLNVYAMTPDELSEYDPRITKVTRIGANTWKFIVDANADKQDADDYLYIAVNAHGDCGPAYYTISGILEQIPY